jgi:hypothetical protein
MSKTIRTVVAAVAVLGWFVAPASAQGRDDRTVGRSGALSVGFSGFLGTGFTSSNPSAPWEYQLQLEFGRFLTNGLLLKGALVGNGQFNSGSSFGGGSAAPSMFGGAEMDYYFAPNSVTSPYVGALYEAALNNRPPGDNGEVFSKVGVQTMLSPHAGFFGEAGYGFELSTQSGGERLQRVQILFGLRFLF